MARKKVGSSNEWEFQGVAVTRLNEILGKRTGLALDRATQETRTKAGKRSDIVVWKDCATRTAFLTVELKNPETRIDDSTFFLDAEAKARHWKAPYFAVWNMKHAELYRVSEAGPTTPADRIASWGPIEGVHDVDAWRIPEVAARLNTLAESILDKAWEDSTRAAGSALIPIDSSLFVKKVQGHLERLRTVLAAHLDSVTRSSKTKAAAIRAYAAELGLLDSTENISVALGGRYSYRVIGQILFYFALRRKQPSLPALKPGREKKLSEELQTFWDQVRRFDYEALYGPDRLDNLIDVPAKVEEEFRAIVDEFSKYDWNALRDDVLGSVFENLIPAREQELLGQYFTPAPVADLLLAFTLSTSADAVLDPACGSGTFLMRAYDYLDDFTGLPHEELLARLWGFDISGFATELSAINLYRRNLSSFANFPRVLPGSFFDRRPGEIVSFPPAKKGGAQEKVSLPVPLFDAVVGNPPYLRSQKQDDLDPAYKKTLFDASIRAGIRALPKTDLFAFFVYHALPFLKKGGRLAFVTPVTWLTADYAKPLQRLLFEELRPVAIVASSVESFFYSVAVNTVLLIAEKPEKDKEPARPLKFVNLRKPLATLFPAGSSYWKKLETFAAAVEAASGSVEGDGYRINVLDGMAERERVLAEAGTRNWSRWLRAPLSYAQVFAP
jgi:methylase of polypeptide subunit release factors